LRDDAGQQHRTADQAADRIAARVEMGVHGRWG
jgi:hypothetical protein